MKLIQYNIQHFKYLIYETFIGFVILYIFFWIIGYKEDIPDYKLRLQFFYFISYFGAVSLSFRFKDYKTLLYFIFIYSLLLSTILRIVFWEYFNLPFGDAVDSYKYEDIVVSALKSGYNKLLNNNYSEFDIDDIGYSTILWTVYNISNYGYGQGVGQAMMLILNAVVICISSLFIYKTCILLITEKRIAVLSTALFGFFPFLYVTASVGLKENFFCLIVCYFFYCAYKFKYTKSRSFFWGALLMVGVAYLFRFAISLMLLFILVLSIISNNSNRKMIIVSGLIGLCLFPVLGVMIVEAFTGVSFELVLAVADSRNQRMESAVSGPIIQIIGALLGPFPNFSRTVQYGILHSSGLLLKSSMSLIVLIQLWGIIMKAQWRYYAICFYYLAGLLMLIIAGVSLDMRFAVTFYPAFIIIFALALKNKLNWKLIYIGQIGIFGLIILYNLR